MSKRKPKRKSLIRVYVARAIAIIVVLTMLTLMICGCLYIREHWFGKKEEPKVEDTQTDSEVTPETDAPTEDVDTPDTEADAEPDAPEAIVMTPSTKYAGFSVVIDPGHGGNDGGTLNGDTIEKDINLDVSLKLAEFLKSQGIEVIMTRDYDDYVSLEERVYITNQTTADFFISLHCNFYEGDSSIDGFEAFYCVDSPAHVYAENIVAKAEETGEIVIRGATENNYFVTRKAEMDSILIEMGFLSNPEECSKLASEEYHSIMAKAIADGIFATFDEKAAGDTTEDNA